MGQQLFDNFEGVFVVVSVKLYVVILSEIRYNILILLLSTNGIYLDVIRGTLRMDKKECLQLLKKFEGSSFINYCGIEMEGAECGWVRTSMKVKKEITNPFGYIHGGALNTLIDTTGGIVCWTVGCTVCTLELSTSFIKNVRSGHIIFSEAKIISKTNHVVFVDIKVYSDEGETLSRARGTYYITGVYDKIPPKW